MANHIPKAALTALEDLVRRAATGVSSSDILRGLTNPVAPRTLQYRLRHLVKGGRLVMEGGGRWARYRMPDFAMAPCAYGGVFEGADDDSIVLLSKAGAAVRDYVRLPLGARKPVGYSRAFLDAYRPNVTFYLTEQDRAKLAAVGCQPIAAQPAGTLAKQILGRQLIDFAWNSSRLEGNTYSLLDTKRLIEFGKEAEGRSQGEAQMILNHKDAIEFLVNGVDDIGFNRYTLLNLHALLANNLLGDRYAAGRLRRIAVGIERSVFYPLELPQLIEENFDQILATVAAISDPYEQAFFVMVHLPYLQPFENVNKRVSRLAANIPLVLGNLVPLSFTDVPRRDYIDAMLGVYELNSISLLKDVFLWAYARSADRHAAVRQTLGEPDPFRLLYREPMRDLVADLVRTRVARRDVLARIAAGTLKTISPRDRDRFAQEVEAELTSLHEGNFARYRIRPSEFAAWRQVWDGRWPAGMAEPAPATDR